MLETLRYRGIVKSRLCDAQAKHVPRRVETPLIFKLRRLAESVGYPYAEIGTAQGLSLELDRFYVSCMVRMQEIRPIKLVLVRDGRMWVDNTHWALAALISNNLNVQIERVPHYLVDLRGQAPNVIGAPASLLGRHLELAIRNAQNIQKRLDRGWRPVGLTFTLGDLAVLGGYLPRSKG